MLWIRIVAWWQLKGNGCVFPPEERIHFCLKILLQETNVWPELSKLFPLISFAFLFFFHERKKKKIILHPKTEREKGGKHLVIIKI